MTGPGGKRAEVLAAADGHGVDRHGVARDGLGGHGVARSGVARAADGPADDGRSQFFCDWKALQVPGPLTGDRPAFASGSGRLGLAPGGQFPSHPGLAPGHGPGEQAHYGDRQNQAHDQRHDDGHGILEGPPRGQGHYSGHGQGGCGTTAAAARVVKARAAHREYVLSGRPHRHTRIKPDVTVAGPGHRLDRRPARVLGDHRLGGLARRSAPDSHRARQVARRSRRREDYPAGITRWLTAHARSCRKADRALEGPRSERERV